MTPPVRPLLVSQLVGGLVGPGGPYFEYAFGSKDKALAASFDFLEGASSAS